MMRKIFFIATLFIISSCINNNNYLNGVDTPINYLTQFIRSSTDYSSSSAPERARVKIFLGNPENDYFQFGTFLNNEEMPELGCRGNVEIMVIYDKEIGPRNIIGKRGHPEAPYREAIVSGIPKKGDFSTIFGALLFTANFVIEDARIESYTGRTC
ncbi:hypothetical protein [Erythrobacter sp. SG61-1L]|uniref:hypothetical protein n=1 Tax=Erythrobacter sp. SG61-1L TaxID=1603897 RepID=UPI0012E299A9|nr:hypothetical protein [Erythrobacter sp. SG61-1L]